MNLVIEIENASAEEVPEPATMRRWVAAALTATQREHAEICVRIVGEEEGRSLNRSYRQRDYATNVLSFPANLPADLELPLLGDLAICAEVVTREAVEQGKHAAAHWAHMLVHGTLHLLGYDHSDDEDAEQMEALETGILVELGFPPPYEQPVAPAAAEYQEQTMGPNHHAG